MDNRRFFKLTVGLFLLVTIAFWKGHSGARYVRLLSPLTPLTSSAALRFTTLASLARSIHGLAPSLCSLPRRTVENHKSVFMLRSRSMETNAIVVVTRNTPIVDQENFIPLRVIFFLSYTDDKRNLPVTDIKEFWWLDIRYCGVQLRVEKDPWFSADGACISCIPMKTSCLSDFL